LETSLERLAAEPGATALQLAQANGMLASSHRFAHAMIALEAGIPEVPAEAPRLQFEGFANAAEKTLELISAKLRGQRIAEREFPDLREAYRQLIQTADMQSDRMVNSLNTLREQTTDWTRGTAAQSKRTMDVKPEWAERR
jgi:hypothetical protein